MESPTEKNCQRDDKSLISAAVDVTSTIKTEPVNLKIIKIESRPRRAIKKFPITSIENYKEDKKQRKKPKKFTCTLCPKKRSFSNSKLLQKHNENVHKDSSRVVCEICSVSLKSEAYYKRHRMTRHPEVPKKYICDYDGRTYSHKDYLRIHMDRHRQHQILTCTICQKSYISKHTFRRHLKMHIEKFVCGSCGIVFNQKTLLDNHYASKHSDELPYSCPFCTRRFPSKTARNNHKYIAHKGNSGPSFKCHECNIFFEMKEELRIHSFIHFNGEIKMCLENGCDQIFKTNRLLKIHMQKHEKKKSFQCPTCGDFFTFNTGLAKHIRLNRCKGPSSLTQEPAEELKVDIALQQLQEITRSKRNLKKKQETDDEMSFNESESESENDEFEKFFEPPQKKIKIEKEVKTEPEEKLEENLIEETKQTRKVRKRKKIYEEVIKDEPITKQRLGRPHLIYTCDFCGEDIKFKKQIILHMKSHALYQKYLCKECDASFKSRKKLVDHCVEEHQIKPQVVVGAYTCEVCNRSFDVRSTFETHKLSHDENARTHFCSICQAGFKSVGNLRRHEAIHVEARNFHCSNCTKSFKTQLALKIHSEAVHAEVKVFVNCQFCSAIVQEKHLRSHIKNQHTEEGKEKPFECSICHKTFRTEKLGQRHFEGVHEPKNLGVVYYCPHCPELEFYRQRELKEHSFVHYDGIIFQCECSKLFKTKRLLMLHQQAVHLNDPGKFPCKICENVTFKTRGGLRKHNLKLHTEKNPEHQ